MAEQPTQLCTSASTDSSTVSRPGQQSQIFRGLSDSCCLLTIEVEGSEDRFSSSILSVDRNQQVLTLSEFFPASGHQLASKNRKLNVTGFLEGVSVEFSAVIHNIGRDGDDSFYSMPFPDELTYGQQREDFRVHFGITARPAIELCLKDGSSLVGELINLSVGGALAALPAGSTLNAEEALLNCKIRLAEQDTLEINAETRHVQVDSKTKALKVGLHFAQLDRSQLKVIQRHVTNAQRKNARNQ